MSEKLTQELMDNYTVIAKILCNKDYYLYHDIQSNLYLRAMESDIEDYEILRIRGWVWAKDYLRSKQHYYTYKNKFPHISLEAAERAGIQIDIDGNVHIPRNMMRLEFGWEPENDNQEDING